MTLDRCLHRPGPRRVLCLDAGGMRAVLSLGILLELEAKLRALHDDPELRLSDFFDLFSGTSAGAVIAAGLAQGHAVAEVLEHFHRFGDRVFARRSWQPWRALYCVQPLREEIGRLVGDRRLTDGAFRAGLMVFTKRADTNQTWAFCNDPAVEPHADLLLRDVLRASCSVPALFPPKVLRLGEGQHGVFVDGGVGPAVDPTLSTYFRVTDPGGGLGWEPGTDELLLVSIGTGHWDVADGVSRVARRWSGGWLQQLPTLILDDTARQSRGVLRSMSRCPAWFGEPGGTAGRQLAGGDTSCTYLRYDVSLEPDSLDRFGGLAAGQDAGDLHHLTCSKARFELARIGRSAGRAIIRRRHFPEAFRLRERAVLS